MGIFRKETEADKLRSEIASINVKKNAATLVNNNEKNQLLEKKMDLMRQIGVNAYGLYKNNVYEYDFIVQFEEIDAIDVEILGKANKLAEILQKYDEEIQILKTNLSYFEGVGLKCSNCGGSITSEDKFCQNCGNII